MVGVGKGVSTIRVAVGGGGAGAVGAEVGSRVGVAVGSGPGDGVTGGRVVVGSGIRVGDAATITALVAIGRAVGCRVGAGRGRYLGAGVGVEGGVRSGGTKTQVPLAQCGPVPTACATSNPGNSLGAFQTLTARALRHRYRGSPVWKSATQPIGWASANSWTGRFGTVARRTRRLSQIPL